MAKDDQVYDYYARAQNPLLREIRNGNPSHYEPDIWHQVSLAIETWDMTRTERLILRALEALHKERNRD